MSEPVTTRSIILSVAIIILILVLAVYAENKADAATADRAKQLWSVKIGGRYPDSAKEYSWIYWESGDSLIYSAKVLSPHNWITYRDFYCVSGIVRRIRDSYNIQWSK